MKYLVLLIFVNSIFLCVFAQQTNNDTITLQPVTVTSQKIQKSDMSIIPMQTMRVEEIDRISGLHVSDVVKLFSGTVLKDYGGIGGLKTVMIRSLGTNHTGIFVDGVKMNDIASGQIDLGRLSLLTTEEISLIVGHSYSGCQPAAYYASANVISVHSSLPNTAQKWGLQTGYKTGSWGLLNPFVTGYTKLGTRTHIALSANMFASNSSYPYRIRYGSLKDTLAYRENSDVTTYQIHTDVVSVFQDSSQLHVKVQYDDSERGLPGAIVFYNPYSNQRLWNRDIFTNLRYANHLSKRIQYLANAKYARNMLRYKDPDYLNNEGGIDNLYIQQEYYSSFAFSWQATEKLSCSFANDISTQMLEANLNEYVNPQRLTTMHALSLNYLHAKFEFGTHLLGTFLSEKTEKGHTAPDSFVLDYSVATAYKITNKPSLRLRILYAKNFRSPTFHELYYGLVGNSNLLPEDVKQFNFGLLGQFNFAWIDYLSFKADFFHNRVENKIVAVPTKNLFIWSMRNISEVYINGFELQTSIQTKSFYNVKFAMTLNYTFQDAKDMTLEGTPTYRQQIPYIPFETMSAMSSLIFNKIIFSYTFVFNGHCFVLGENIYEHMLPAWTVHDFTIGYSTPFRNTKLTMKAEVSNLFNRQYEIVKNFPMQGRYWGVSMSIKI